MTELSNDQWDTIHSIIEALVVAGHVSHYSVDDATRVVQHVFEREEANRVTIEPEPANMTLKPEARCYCGKPNSQCVAENGMDCHHPFAAAHMWGD